MLATRYTRALATLTTFTALFLLVCAWRVGVLFPTTHTIPAPYTVNLNKDDAQTIALLPGIGQEMADKIVASRYLQGPYTSYQSLTRVPGISSDTIKRITPYTTLGRR
jgi:DNA uptake protein ComE-like DNA-binding protein